MKKWFCRDANDLAPPVYPDIPDLFWNKGLAMQCHHFDLQTPLKPEKYTGVKAGDLVWVRTRNFSDFYKKILPGIREPFVLVTADGYETIPLELNHRRAKRLLDDHRLIHWFTQNLRQEEPLASKLSPLPLGIDFHTAWERRARFPVAMTPREQETQLSSVLNSSPPARERLARVFADFHFNNTSQRLRRKIPGFRKDRATIYRQLKNNAVIDFLSGPLPRDQFWRKLAGYQFVISPHGSGLDCHRTWEALALGCFVIVEKSPLDSLYGGLPVVILDDFDEITGDNLARWAGMFLQATSMETTLERTSTRYWLDKIRTRAEGALHAGSIPT